MAGAITPQSRPLLSGILIAVALITGAKNNGFAEAQSPAILCAPSLITLSPCLTYVTGNATTSAPPQRCCGALASVVQSSAVCLCMVFTTNLPLTTPINRTRAQALPGACKVSIPPLSQCKATVGAPAPSPSVGGSGGGAPPSSKSVPSLSPGPSPSPSTSTSTPTPTATPTPTSTPTPTPTATPTPTSTPLPPSNDSPSIPTPTPKSPSNDSPSAIPPTTSVGGKYPPASQNPTTNAGVNFTPSAFLGVFAAVIIASIVY